MAYPASVLYARLLARARLRQLQLLMAVVDHGTLKRAAEDVDMSQPAATQAIRELERVLGVSLFERQARGMALSQAGKVVLPVVRQVLQALQTSMETLASVRSGASGVLRIGAIPAVVASELGASLIALGKLNPGLQIQIVEGMPERLLAELSGGTLNLLLTRRPAELGQRYRFESLARDEAVFGAGLGHPLARREAVSLDDLLDYPWLRTPPGVNVTAVFEQVLAGGGHTPMLHPISTSSALLITEILADNRTITIGPASTAGWFIRHGLGARLAVDRRFPLEDLGVIHAAAEADDPPIAACLGLLRAAKRERGHDPPALGAGAAAGAAS